MELEIECQCAPAWLLHRSLVAVCSLFRHPRVVVRSRGSLLCVTYRMGGFHRTLLFLSFQFGWHQVQTSSHVGDVELKVVTGR